MRCRICPSGEALSASPLAICPECRESIGPELLARMTSNAIALRRGPDDVGEATDLHGDLWAEARERVARAGEIDG